MVKQNTNERIHGIDALRAIAMLLGIVLHATIAYKVAGIPTWPHDKSFNHWGYDYLYIFIHSFRMPLFFLIAGYFCRFLYFRNGEKSFVNHRTKRIFIPFAFSLIFILPITIFPFLVNRFASFYPGQWDLIFKKAFRQSFQWNGMAHLWFLYYLLIYYISVLAIQRVRNIFVKQVKNMSPIPALKFKLIPFSLVSVMVIWIILLQGQVTYLHVDTGILPRLPFLLFYGVFFYMGWVFNNHKHVFQRLTTKVWPFIFVGLALSALIFYFDFFNLYKASWHTTAFKFLAAVQILLLVYGIIGFFLRYFVTESRLWKYISDASYWMYLIHLGIIAGLQVGFEYSNVAGPLRFIFSLLITFGVTIATYEAFVRYTIIGKYLHGPREKEKKSGIKRFLFYTAKKLNLQKL